MRHWSIKTDYTRIRYVGYAPLNVAVSRSGSSLLIPDTSHPPEERFPTAKEAGSLVCASKLIESIDERAKALEKEFLPSGEVLSLISRVTHYSLLERIDLAPVDITRWPDPPHVALANSSIDTADRAKQFVRRYGFGAGMALQTPVLRKEPLAVTIPLQKLKNDQEFLRRIWTDTELGWLKETFGWAPDDIDFVNGAPRLKFIDLWDYTLILFMIDASLGKLKVCPNPECKTLKYFVRERKNQKYCSAVCKNTFNVKNWLANSENRKRWNLSRQKTTNKGEVRTP